MAHRVAEEVDVELDDIWLYIAKQSGSIEIADKVADSITACFVTLGRNPHLGRRRDDDFGAWFTKLSRGELRHCLLHRRRGWR
jgi:plasmid stabilization system protein ParE